MTERCITKAEAIQSQLECVISLFFRNDDPIAIHTLCGAIDLLITDIAESRDVKLGYHELRDSCINGKEKKEVIFLERKPRNFFKHAETDPEGTLTFNSEVNTYLLFILCEHFEQLFPDRNHISKLYIYAYQESMRDVKEYAVIFQSMDKVMSGCHTNEQRFERMALAIREARRSP